MGQLVVLQLVVLLSAIALTGCVFWVRYRMAVRRDRSAGLWLLISLVGAPILAILLLMALGTKKVKEAS